MNELASIVDRRRALRAALALFWLAAALLALGASPYWRISPDSALYTGIARSVATGEGYTFSGDAQPSIPPVTPLYLAAAYKAAHLVDPSLPFMGTFAWFNGFIAVAGMAGLLAAFFLVIELAGLWRAVLVLAFLVTSRQYFLHSIQPLTDVPYAAVSWAALLFLLRAERSGGWGSRVAAALLLALAPLTRLVGPALVLAVVVYYLALLVRGGDRGRTGRTGLVVAVPAVIASVLVFYAIFASSSGPAFNYWNDLGAHRTFGEVVSRAGHDLALVPGSIFEAVVGLESVYGMGFALAGVIAIGAVRSWKRGGRLAVLYFILYFLYVAMGEEPLPRYVVPLLPIVYLFMIEGFAAIWAWLEGLSASPRAMGVLRGALAGLAGIVIFANLFYDAREIKLNFSRDFYASYRHGRWTDYLALSAALAKDPPAGRVMMYHPREVTAVSGLPTAWLPYNPETTYRATDEDCARYVKDLGIAAIVTDPDDAGSAAYLEGFIERGPLQWREKARFGRLTLYVQAH